MFPLLKILAMSIGILVKIWRFLWMKHPMYTSTKVRNLMLCLGQKCPSSDYALMVPHVHLTLQRDHPKASEHSLGTKEQQPDCPQFGLKRLKISGYFSRLV